MAQSISALNAALPLSSDCSTFISKSPIPKSYKLPKTNLRTNTIKSVLKDRIRTRNPQQMINGPLAYSYSTIPDSTPSTQNGSYGRGRTPWEIKERETEYKMRFDMPGMTKEDVKVWVEENMLVVQAEKAEKRKQEKLDGEEGGEEEEEWPAKSFGRYRNMIALPENIEFEKIKAEVKDGVLYITIPKAAVSARVLNIAVQ